MDKLLIQGKNHTPLVDLNPETGFFYIKGESFPENPFTFYKPVLDWISLYFSQVSSEKETVFQIRLTYLNTSSTKIFMMILDLCSEAMSRGRKVNVHWQYAKNDDLVREMGEDLGFDLSESFFKLEEVL